MMIILEVFLVMDSRFKELIYYVNLRKVSSETKL